MEVMEIDSVKTVNVFKKRIGKVLISTLFKIELNIEKRLIFQQQKAFCMWRLKVMSAKAKDAARSRYLSKNPPKSKTRKI